MSENVGNRQPGQSGQTDTGAAIIREDKERRATGAEEAVIRDAIAEGGHGMLADTKPDVAAPRIAGGKIAAVFDVVFGAAKEVGAASDKMWHGLGHHLQDLTAAVARR